MKYTNKQTVISINTNAILHVLHNALEQDADSNRQGIEELESLIADLEGSENDIDHSNIEPMTPPAGEPSSNNDTTQPHYSPALK